MHLLADLLFDQHVHLVYSLVAACLFRSWPLLAPLCVFSLLLPYLPSFLPSFLKSPFIFSFCCLLLPVPCSHSSPPPCLPCVLPFLSCSLLLFFPPSVSHLLFLYPFLPSFLPSFVPSLFSCIPFLRVALPPLLLSSVLPSLPACLACFRSPFPSFFVELLPLPSFPLSFPACPHSLAPALCSETAQQKPQTKTEALNF